MIKKVFFLFLLSFSQSVLATDLYSRISPYSEIICTLNKSVTIRVSHDGYEIPYSKENTRQYRYNQVEFTQLSPIRIGRTSIQDKKCHDGIGTYVKATQYTQKLRLKRKDGVFSVLYRKSLEGQFSCSFKEFKSGPCL